MRYEGYMEIFNEGYSEGYHEAEKRAKELEKALIDIRYLAGLRLGSGDTTTNSIWALACEALDR